MAKTQIRITPLKSSLAAGAKYSLKGSLVHNFRQYKEQEDHIDYTQKNFNLYSQTEEQFMARLEAIKLQYKMATKKSTIDVVESVFTVNAEYFQNDKLKESFIHAVHDFVLNQCDQEKARILNISAHLDESSFHIHAYYTPVVECKYKNCKEKRINYRQLYSETKTEVAQKKKDGTPLKLEKIQDLWAFTAQKYLPDLERGTSKKITGAKNLTPKEYREKMNKINNLDHKIEQKESQLTKISDDINILTNTKNKITNEFNDLVGIYKAAQKTVASLNARKIAVETKLKEKSYILTQYQRKIDNFEKPTKEEMQLFRSLTLNSVYRLCGEASAPSTYIDNAGKERKIANPLDYLMFHQKLSYAGAVSFLRDYFGDRETFKAITQEGYKELTEHEKQKAVLIDRQMKALGYPPVRVSVIDTKNNEQTPKIIGKNYRSTENEETFFNYKELCKNISYLSVLNAQGCNIFITPIEYESVARHAYFLIDDVRDLDAMKADLGEPNLLQETSEGSLQAIYKVTKDYISGTSDSARNYTNLFKHINDLYGDIKISGTRHPFRLAGYSNQKEGKNQFFTKIISTYDKESETLNRALASETYNINRAKEFEQVIKNTSFSSIQEALKMEHDALKSVDVAALVEKHLASAESKLATKEEAPAVVQTPQATEASQIDINALLERYTASAYSKIQKAQEERIHEAQKQKQKQQQHEHQYEMSM